MDNQTRQTAIDTLRGSLALYESILKMHEGGRDENKQRARNKIAEIKAEIKNLGGDA